jgi:hypothetical protein
LNPPYRPPSYLKFWQTFVLGVIPGVLLGFLIIFTYARARENLRSAARARLILEVIMAWGRRQYDVSTYVSSYIVSRARER